VALSNIQSFSLSLTVGSRLQVNIILKENNIILNIKVISTIMLDLAFNLIATSSLLPA